MQEKTGYFTGQGGLKLFYRAWEPAEQPVGSLVLVHGVNEHGGRYRHVAEFFTAHGLAVYALDHRGFGQSEGTRCYIDSFDDYIRDLRQFVGMAQGHGQPLMLGHSLGGLIAYRYALTHPDTIRGLVLTSPFFGLKAKVRPLEKALAPLLAKLLPRLQMGGNLKPEHVCRDAKVVEAYIADPLVWKKVTPRWFAESIKALEECHRQPPADLKLPVLFLQAGDDQIVDPDATRAIYTQVPHERKAFKLYPGMYHEIMNDPGQTEVFGDILAWLKEHELVC